MQLNLPMHLIKADVYIKKGEEYTTKDGEKKVSSDQKRFNSIAPCEGSVGGGIDDDDIPF